MTTAAWPRFDCPGCGRNVAARHRVLFVSCASPRNGRRHQYAYLRRHHDDAGVVCPVSTVRLATIVGRARAAAGEVGR